MPGSAPAGLNTLPAAAPGGFGTISPHAAPLTLTADQAVVLAVRRNLGVLAALQDVFAARSGVKAAAALTPPTFAIGPALQMGGTTDGFIFEQPLELNGTRRARAGVAQAQLKLTQAQALVQLQGLVYTARTDFNGLARAQARLTLARALLTTAEQFHQIARKQAALGARPGIEQAQTAIEESRARQQVLLAESDEQVARSALNAYLGRALLDPITIVPVTMTAPSSAPVDLEAAQRQALVARAEIAVAEATQSIPRAQARLYRAEGRLDVAPEFRINEITPRYQDAGLGVVITVPVDYGTRRNQVRREERTAAGAQARVVGTQALVRQDVVQAVTRLQSAQAVLQEFDAGLLANAQQVLDARRFGFQEGQTTIIEVLDALRTYRLVLSDRADAQAAAVQARADLDRATGTVPPALSQELQRDLGASDVPPPMAVSESGTGTQ